MNQPASCSDGNDLQTQTPAATSEVDRIFQSPTFPIDFRFDDQVAGVFDDMARRSIPGYEEAQSIVCRYAALFYAPGTKMYDLGCSTGTLLLQLLSAIPHLHALYGIDVSAPMLQRARAKLGSHRNLNLALHDLRDVSVKGSSVVIANYTLQFLPIKDRPAVLRTIYEGLEAGGILILSEKLAGETPTTSEALTRAYHDFKRQHRYLQQEILRKQESLKRVMFPLSASQNLALLSSAGFLHTECIYRAHNFASFLSIKEEG